MLETRLPSREITERTSARPLPYAPVRPATRESARTKSPARVRRPLSASDRMARSETRLLTMAVSCTAFVCGLLVIYLAAYAHISMLGNEQAQMRSALREKRLDNETLRATLASLQSPNHVAAAATALGMTCDHRHTYYITPPSRALNLSASSASAPNDTQVANSGPTDNDNSAHNN